MPKPCNSECDTPSSEPFRIYKLKFSSPQKCLTIFNRYHYTNFGAGTCGQTDGTYLTCLKLLCVKNNKQLPLGLICSYRTRGYQKQKNTFPVEFRAPEYRACEGTIKSSDS
jgi:hypothetical protein